jgi:DNA-binding NarL/FixJ family response regulator
MRPVNSAIQVLLLDSQPVVHLGIQQLLGTRSGIDLCGKISRLDRLHEEIHHCRPDVIVSDLSPHLGYGLELIADLSTHSTKAKVLVYSQGADHLYATRALRAGAFGYVRKTDPPDLLVEGIHAVATGSFFVKQDIHDTLWHEAARGTHSSREAKFGIDRLSNRELAVFECIGRGLNNRQIGELYHLSPKTVETYRSNIRRKLGLQTADELVYAAMMENGAIPSSSVDLNREEPADTGQKPASAEREPQPPPSNTHLKSPKKPHVKRAR